MYREIERKFHIQGISIAEAEYLVRKALPIKESTHGRGVDYYFKSPMYSTPHFVRVRELGDSDFELTIKNKDQLTNVNRLEINVNGQNRSAMIDMCRLLFGTEIERLDKTYSNLYLYDLSVVTLYTIRGRDLAILEVEGVSEQVVNKIVGILTARVPLKEEPRSLYEMLVQPKESIP
jgi:CYTH domain-containing protein